MNKDALTLAILKALAYTENGGKPDLKNTKAGASGELKSVFQFLPETWKRQSKEVTGQDNLEATPDNEALVAKGVISPIVEKGLSEGKSPDEIATEVGSFWNSGKITGAKQGLMGTNKKGVKYDVPAYAKKVVSYTNQFMKELGGQGSEENSNESSPIDGSKLASIQDFVSHVEQTNPQAIQKPETAKVQPLAADAPLPQNNNVTPGMIPSAQKIPGMIA